MPMSFSLTQMILISAAYLAVLFGVAWISERGMIPRAIIRHPLTYTLSLGVYASAWAFYGTVGLAYQYGYGFLSSYLGVSGAFLLAPVLLYPILKITRTYQLSSLADLFAFRFRSTWAGALTTIFMLIGVLPLLALQIQAVADSIGILTGEPIQSRVALAFCALIILFTIFFGSRHIATREKHEGLVFAIAFESVIKLIALGGVGLYALYGVFDGPQQLELWLLQNQTALAALHTPLQEGPWRTLLLVFFASAIVMPHMYHMTFTENLNPRSLVSASWGLPLFLLLMSLAVPLILWAGLKLGATTNPEYFTLGIGIAANSKAAGVARLCRRFVGGQRPDHRHHPGAVGHGAEPPGAAALSAAGRRQHLSLAEVDPPGADRRDHHGRFRFLPDARRRAGSGQPRHRRVCGDLAIPAGRVVGAVLADRQPSRLYRRSAGGDSGLGGDHAAAAGRQSAGFLHPAAEHDLRARRHQLAHGGHRLARRQRA